MPNRASTTSSQPAGGAGGSSAVVVPHLASQHGQVIKEQLILGRTDPIVEAAAPAKTDVVGPIAPANVVLTDYDLQSTRNGLDVLRLIKSEWPATQVILMSGYSTLDSAVAGVRAGAFDYLAKPFDIREAMACVDRAFTTQQPLETLPIAGGALPAGLVGRTREMLDVYKQIALAADATTPVLVTGESGTGK